MAKQIRSNRNVGNRPKKNRGQVKANTNPKFNNRVKKRGINSKPKVQDARQKILQKKRKVADARDVLTRMAKTQDARSKLDKIRTSRGAAGPLKANVKVIGSNILQKVDRNGKISLVTNKPRATSHINLAVQKQLGLIAQSKPQMKKTPPKRTVVQKNLAPIRKAVANAFDYALPIVEQPTVRDLYRWVKPDLRTASNLIGSLESTRQAMRDVMREEILLANLVTPKPIRPYPSAYVDLDAVADEEMPLVHASGSRIALQGSSRVSNVHSRLDGVSSQPASHGILSQAKTKVVVPAGHRIVISNLKSSVTEDDIKELFEDIGQLLSAKLVRAGVAEVIYKNLKDAQNAVDTYHNRQLDGQPMKCLLVNKRPLNQPTGAPLGGTAGILGRKTSASESVSKLVPDLDTIHKVLFQRK